MAISAKAATRENIRDTHASTAPLIERNNNFLRDCTPRLAPGHPADRPPSLVPKPISPEVGEQIAGAAATSWVAQGGGDSSQAEIHDVNFNLIKA